MENGKKSMSLFKVECYACTPSGVMGQDGSHGFVVSLDRKTCWANHGGCWSSYFAERKCVASANMYKEWVDEFMPANDYDKGGLSFLVNGVCHTYANRELLVTDSGPTMKQSFMDYIIVFFFGTYGLGLKQLKQILKASYERTIKSYSDSGNAYNKVLSRLEPSAFLDDELDAWILVAKHLKINKIDSIMEKPLASRYYAKQRILKVFEQRERLYEKFLNNDLNSSSLHKEIGSCMINELTSGFDYLLSVSYITKAERDQYLGAINQFFAKFVRQLANERAYFEIHNCAGGLSHD